jgi:hypothetical protein
MQKYQRVVSLIKPSTVTVGNLGQAAGVGGGLPVNIRVVNDSNAPGYATVDYDRSHPYRGKELLAVVNGRLPEGAKKLNAHDLLAVRRVHQVESQANFYHKGKFSSPQYSDAFADWLLEECWKDEEFFAEARFAYKETY